MGMIVGIQVLQRVRGIAGWWGGAGVWCAKEQPPQRWGNLVKKQESPILPLLLGAGVPSVVSAAHTVRLAIVESGSIESLEN